MQKIKFFSFLIIAVLFINACGSDDDSNNTPNPDPTPTAEEFIKNDNDAVVYYPFNGNANNELGSSYNGTITDATAIADRNGIANAAYNLTGLGNINFGDVNITSGNFTISFWVKIPEFTGDDSYRILSKRATCTEGRFFDIAFASNTRGLGMELRGGGSASFGASASDFPIDEWVHVVFVVSSDNYTTSMYWNGELKDETDWGFDPGFTFQFDDNTDMGVSTSPCINTANTLGFQGSIDDIVIFNRALSTNDIATLGH